MKFINKKKILLTAVTLYLTASEIFAKTFSEVVAGFVDGLLKQVTELALLFAVLFFVWKIFKFVMALGQDANAKEVQEGKKWMTFAILIFFLFTSIFGLVMMARSSLDLNNSEFKSTELHINHISL